MSLYPDTGKEGVNCGPGHQMYKKTSAALDVKPPHVVDIEP